MGFRYRNPGIKIGDTTIRKNKKGFSLSRRTKRGDTVTYNSATGKTTRIHRTGIPGLSWQTVRGGKGLSGCLGCCVYVIGALALLAALLVLIL